MVEDDEFDAMAEACVVAAERVMRIGSPALRAAMRVALCILGRDIAQRALAAPTAGGNGLNGGDGAG